MAGTFVPFFEKATSGESLPQYQFNQYKLSKVTLAHPPQNIRHIDKHELKTKAISDLRNALNLSLPPDAIQQIAADLTKLKTSEKPLLESLQRDPEADAAMSSDAAEGANIKLQKDGDKVTNIMVECECGQVIALDCIY
jgi:hypothetical protein